METNRRCRLLRDGGGKEEDEEGEAPREQTRLLVYILSHCKFETKFNCLCQRRTGPFICA